MSDQFLLRADGPGEPHRRTTDCDGRCLPVVVISPEDREQVERLLTAYLNGALGRRTPADAPIRSTGIDYLQTALREFASPTPPKPDEPLGLGARVTDRGGLEWAARTGFHPAPDGMGMTERRWGCLNGRESDRTWDELLDTRGPLEVDEVTP